MNKLDRARKMLREALQGAIQDDKIILEITVNRGSAINWTGTLIPLPSLEILGHTIHHVNIDTFIDLHKKVLLSGRIKPKDMLPKMLILSHKVNGKKVNDIGYNKFISIWITQGVTLKEVNNG